MLGTGAAGEPSPDKDLDSPPALGLMIPMDLDDHEYFTSTLGATTDDTSGSASASMSVTDKAFEEITKALAASTWDLTHEPPRAPLHSPMFIESSPPELTLPLRVKTDQDTRETRCLSDTQSRAFSPVYAHPSSSLFSLSSPRQAKMYADDMDDRDFFKAESGEMDDDYDKDSSIYLRKTPPQVHHMGTILMEMKMSTKTSKTEDS